MINDPHHTQLALRPTYHTSAARITLHDKKPIVRWDSERELFYDDIFNHFYEVRPGNYEIRWSNLVYNFLLVI